MSKFLVVCQFFLLVAIGSASYAETLVLGGVNDNVRKQVKRFSPLAAYLEKVLADDGIDTVEIKIFATSDAMAEALSAGEVDLYFDSPLVAAKVARQSSAVPFLRRWKQGVAEYHSLIIVPSASDIATVDDLVGRSIGFQEPDSTSGFLLPAALLLHNGLTLRKMDAADVDPPADAIGYVFTSDDENTILWLAKGQIDAGATDPRGWEILNKARPGKFRVIAESITVPRQVVVHRARLAPERVAQLGRVMSAMADSAEGVAAMEGFHKTTRFDVFPLGVEATFRPIYEVLDELQAFGID